jgi:hypothetical protein
VTDVGVMVRGEYRDDAKLRAAMEADRPRVKILKMHGGLKGGDGLLFSREEMNSYPEKMRQFFNDLTRQDILICGYAFQDACVERAFSEQGGSIYFVNPGKAPLNLVPFLLKRRSNDWVIDGEAGKFETFFTQLDRALNRPEEEVARPKLNPFKFLTSYDIRDRIAHGRWPAREGVQATGDTPGRVFTSWARQIRQDVLCEAGLVPRLDPARFLPVYLRCQGDLKTWLPKAIAAVLPTAAPDPDARAAVQRLAASTPRHVVLVLDQFERVVHRCGDTDAGREQLQQCLTGLAECACPNLSFVCVGADDNPYLMACPPRSSRSWWINPGAVVGRAPPPSRGAGFGRSGVGAG